MNPRQPHYFRHSKWRSEGNWEPDIRGNRPYVRPGMYNRWDDTYQCQNGGRTARPGCIDNRNHENQRWRGGNRVWNSQPYSPNVHQNSNRYDQRRRDDVRVNRQEPWWDKPRGGRQWPKENPDNRRTGNDRGYQGLRNIERDVTEPRAQAVHSDQNTYWEYPNDNNDPVPDEKIKLTFINPAAPKQKNRKQQEKWVKSHLTRLDPAAIKITIDNSQEEHSTSEEEGESPILTPANSTCEIISNTSRIPFSQTLGKDPLPSTSTGTTTQGNGKIRSSVKIKATRIMLLGHSFISHLFKHIKSLRRNRNVYQSMKEVLEITNDNIDFTMFAIPSGYIKELKSFERAIANNKPEIILIDMGSNDVCTNESMTSLSLKLHAIMLQWLEKYPHIKLISWARVAYRHKVWRKWTSKSIEQYNIDVDVFNTAMIRLIKKDIRLQHHKHRGLIQLSQVIKHSGDGVHFTSSGGKDKYKKSVTRWCRWSKKLIVKGLTQRKWWKRPRKSRRDRLRAARCRQKNHWAVWGRNDEDVEVPTVKRKRRLPKARRIYKKSKIDAIGNQAN